jgi:hypothetical protein
VPLGYRVEHAVVDDKAVTRRVIDPAEAAVYAEIMDGAEARRSSGAIARALNARHHDQARRHVDGAPGTRHRRERRLRGR